jgi:hypothetical protein
MLTKKMTIIVLLMSLGWVGCSQETETEYIHVGPNWAALHELEPAEASFEVEVETGRRFKMGDELHFAVTSHADGRLWVAQVDPKDELTMLYPNAYVLDNTLVAGQSVPIPPPDAPWSLEASEPPGQSIVAFIVTPQELDLDDVLGTQKSMRKALRLVGESASWGLAKAIIDIEGTDQ